MDPPQQRPESPRQSPLLSLDAHCLGEVLSRLEGPAELASACCACTQLKASISAHGWALLRARRYPFLPEEDAGRSGEAAAAAGSGSVPGGGREAQVRACRRGAALERLSRVRWLRLPEPPRQDPRRGLELPWEREGHAAVAWDGVVAMLGGFTDHGLAIDVRLLDLRAERPAWRRAAASAVGGAIPASVYGHSAVVLRGAHLNGGAAVVRFGGHTLGGYSGEIDELIALRWAAGAAPEPNDAAQPMVEWFEPPVEPGERAPPVGYHAACASEDGATMYVSGGIADGESKWSSLWALDSRTWAWRQLTPTDPDAPEPPPRFGHSMVAAGGAVYVVGGGSGGDLLRDGFDHSDIWRFDLKSRRWSTVGEGLEEGVAGRCHTAVVVPCPAAFEARLLIFGGGIETSNLATSLSFRTPPPEGTAVRLERMRGDVMLRDTIGDAAQYILPRLSQVCVCVGTRVVLHGGWSYRMRAMADTWVGELAPLDGAAEQAAELASLGPSELAVAPRVANPLPNAQGGLIGALGHLAGNNHLIQQQLLQLLGAIESDEDSDEEYPEEEMPDAEYPEDPADAEEETEATDD